MAVGFHIEGASVIKIAAYDTTPGATFGDRLALETLGYSINGIEGEFVPYYSDMRTDRTGGDAGPPADRQYMGQIARVRAQISEYEMSVYKKLQRRLSAGFGEGFVSGVSAGGLLTHIGCAVIGDNQHWRVLIEGGKAVADISGGGTGDEFMTPLNFPTTILEGLIGQNIGTRYSTPSMEFVGYIDRSTGKLYDHDTTGP